MFHPLLSLHRYVYLWGGSCALKIRDKIDKITWVYWSICNTIHQLLMYVALCAVTSSCPLCIYCLLAWGTGHAVCTPHPFSCVLLSCLVHIRKPIWLKVNFLAAIFGCHTVYFGQNFEHQADVVSSSYESCLFLFSLLTVRPVLSMKHTCSSPRPASTRSACYKLYHPSQMPFK